MRVAFRISFFLFLLIFSINLRAQESYFSLVEIVTDTNVFSSAHNSLVVNNTDRICFNYVQREQVVEVRLYPENRNDAFELNNSRDFVLIDSMMFTGIYHRFKVRFTDLNRSELLRFSFTVETDSVITFEEVLLQPVTKTTSQLRITDNELFIGEEKRCQVFSNNPENIKIANEWVNTNNFDYRFSRENSEVFLHVVAKQLGSQELTASVPVIKPSLNEQNFLHYQASPLKQNFNVKASRLQFLGIDQHEITLSEESQLNGLEVQFENSRFLQMNKTYRIEAQEDAGGALIAEIFTKRRLGNNRVLCILRPFNYHRSSEGYLYIKDGDAPKFISNFSITPATQIEDIKILYDGNQWRSTNVVRPGQTIDVKLEGKGMHKANFYFRDIVVVANDSLVRTEKQQVFRLKIPREINKQIINIYNHSEPTGKFLKVAEYQQPRDFDFMYINYGERARKVAGIKEPILYEGIVKDMVISFNTSKIDDQVLYGKQYLDLEVRITGKKDELIELKQINNIAICPTSPSPRALNYNQNDCFNGQLSLNKYIRKETSDLEGWSKISLFVSHSDDKYNENGYKKEVDVILKRSMAFDIELSFPAGLITISKQDNDSIGFGSLSGISLAMIGQFSFYHPEKINRYRPYKIGAGFLALNAFNFSENANNRDVGLVIIGSLYPTTKDTKLTFPLYVGGGYFIKDQKLFFLIGPGIRLKL
jgi:hypothetical protein